MMLLGSTVKFGWGVATIEIIPAIDLKGGKCVRLYQGNYDEETVFSSDPVEMALRWQTLGAPRLHIVDLDGAAAGEPVNLDIIRQIATAALIPTQLGGGIRRLETVEQVLKVGVERVILGTAAVCVARNRILATWIGSNCWIRL